MNYTIEADGELTAIAARTDMDLCLACRLFKLGCDEHTTWRIVS